MYKLLILSIFTLSLQADQCETLYNQAKIQSTQVEALETSAIASFKAYDIINDYLSLASSTVATCSTSDNRNAYRFTRELNADMKRISVLREKFRVQTFEELKAEALIQAKKEAQCVNIYNNTYIQKPKGPSIQPVP